MRIEITETEQELIATARNALSSCNWTVGECAAKWTSRYSRGRTDADFGSIVGLSGDQICQRRLVWEQFADVSDSYQTLKWSHFYTARTWDDVNLCLEWADENQATVAEMKAWRRNQHGEDLTVDEPDTIDELDNVPATPAPMTLETSRDPREAPQQSTAAVSSSVMFPSERVTQPREQSASAADNQKQLTQCLTRLGTAAREAFHIDGGAFADLLRDHLDQLAEDVRQGETPNGLDKQTIDSCVRNIQEAA